MKNESWKSIFEKYSILAHNFDEKPFIITAEQIKQATSQFNKTGQREVRILCKQDCRKDRPQLFVENHLFLLPVKNGQYAIVRGEGYVDIPPIANKETNYVSKLDFKLDSSLVGNSEMQHLDFAYASSLIRTFCEDESLVLTIRGRKYTPEFSFRVGNQKINVKGVQTEVDAGYEGKKQLILVEAKCCKLDNVIIRQLFYPFKQWSKHTKKMVKTLFFEKKRGGYCLYEFVFDDIDDYNSIKLTQSKRYKIVEKEIPKDTK